VPVQATDSLQFNPNTITVSPGAKVTLNVNNVGGAAHNFTAPSLNVGQPVDLPSGKTTAVSFTAPSAAGTYAFWCSLPGHAEAGMTGAVVVK
jgi:nitrite reductase (NO-forming)